ncbi:hypothetical protein BC332_31449 [Capsicum chinense]|nr:hypothetical protein BC332_31449 [Capsicum chinense]
MMVSKIFSLLQFFTLFTITFASTEEATALLKWKSTFKNQNNSLLASWQPSSDACNDWYGVSCVNGRMNTLNITNASAIGTLYAFPFSSLPFLEYLDFSMNNLSGTIPPEIGNLTNLVYLDLNTDQISGTIPSQIGSLVKLQILRIFDNYLNGSIPEEIGYLRSLTKPSLGWNFLNASYSNSLNGSIPASLGNLYNFSLLYLYNNHLSGSIPEEIGYLRSLTELDLSTNSLNGSIPASLGNLNNLSYLYLFENQLSGSIPEEIGQLRSLTELSLRTNFLNGSIPASLGNLNNLTLLNLYENHLSGSIPAEIGKMKSLLNLSLYTNNLSGLIPKTIGDLTELKLLYLYDNQLSGPISKIGKMKSLQNLSLHTNNLSGPIPSELGNLKNLNDLELSNNQLTDSIPSSIGNLRNLHTLFLGNNNLIDEIPSSFCNLTSLTVLYLLKNNLKGKILQCLVNISGLQYVMMSHNNLSGELPLSICNLTSLQVLDLGRNNLIGAISQCFGNMSGHLEVLDMQHNNLSGTLPTTFTIGSALGSFNLHGNKIEEKIPRSLENCQLLEVLDLGDNHLNDTFPMWLGTLPELRVLRLRLNKLHGPIRTLGSGNMYLELRILDISSNAFMGNLPTSLFQHLNAMKKIDPSKKAPSDHERYGYYQNSIAVVTKGMELEVVRILFLYTTIDLSNNKFEGHIPSIIGELIALRMLNLSHNGLQGPIPQSLGSLSSVESLDLSGCIPQRNQFHTFENNSYEGNDGLRGFPLSKGCGNDSHDSVSEKTYAGSAVDEESNSEFLNDFWKDALMGKSSVLLGLSLTVPLMVACLSIAIPIWIRNGYQFWSSRAENAGRAGNHLTLGMKEDSRLYILILLAILNHNCQFCFQGVVLFISISLFAGSILALGAIVSAKPLDDLDYKGWTGGWNSVTSPYASSVFLGWAMASAIVLVVTGVLPIISWFATYRFSLSSAICIGIFAVVIVAFCGVSYFEIVGSRTYQIPTKADFLASLLPLICIPAVLSLGAGLFKCTFRKDDNWKLSRGAYIFIIIGLLLLLGAISAIIVTIKPWAIGAAFLLVLLLLVLAIGVIHYWASNNFYLTRIQCYLFVFLHSF